MGAIYTFDPLASPAPSITDSASQDDTSADEAAGLDVSRLENVYRALMSTLLDTQQAVIPITSEPPEEMDGGTDAVANGAPKNAKRRKMDKKKAKREEQKRMAEETVDVVEFKLFSRMPVKPISLLASEDSTWITPNPRHVQLSEEEEQALRRRIRSVVVEGTDVVASGSRPSKRTLEAYKLESQVSSDTIIHLKVDRALPPFSQAFALTRPGYASAQPVKPTTQGKKSQPSLPLQAPTDPIQAALKRGPVHRSTRAAVHVLFTNNGKVLPAPVKGNDTPSSITTTTTTASIPTTKGTPINRESTGAEAKAHLRRIARRAHRLGFIPPPSHGGHLHITPPTTRLPAATRSPWVNPFLGTHRFWAPAEELGGKSGGYAVGFAGSEVGVREVEGEGRRRRGGAYVRDRMR